MFVKLAVLSCVVAVGMGAYSGPLAGGLPAAQYPAGISPAACPNYPHCTNPALAANPGAPAPPVHSAIPQYHQGAYNQYPYNQQFYNPQPYNQQAYNVQAYVNPYSYNPQAYNPSHYNPGYYGHAQQTVLPAGVDAHSCPNYPFCPQ